MPRRPPLSEEEEGRRRRLLFGWPDISPPASSSSSRHGDKKRRSSFFIFSGHVAPFCPRFQRRGEIFFPNSSSPPEGREDEIGDMTSLPPVLCLLSRVFSWRVVDGSGEEEGEVFSLPPFARLFQFFSRSLRRGRSPGDLGRAHGGTEKVHFLANLERRRKFPRWRKGMQ